MRSLMLSIGAVVIGVVAARAAEPGPWGTYRGNPGRTGNTDNQPGPEKPAVLWVLKSQDHFVASPVPVKDNVYLAGIGAFNRPTVSVFRREKRSSSPSIVRIRHTGCADPATRRRDPPVRSPPRRSPRRAAPGSAPR